MCAEDNDRAPLVHCAVWEIRRGEAEVAARLSLGGDNVRACPTTEAGNSQTGSEESPIESMQLERRAPIRRAQNCLRDWGRTKISPAKIQSLFGAVWRLLNFSCCSHDRAESEFGAPLQRRRLTPSPARCQSMRLARLSPHRCLTPAQTADRCTSNTAPRGMSPRDRARGRTFQAPRIAGLNIAPRCGPR